MGIGQILYLEEDEKVKKDLHHRLLLMEGDFDLKIPPNTSTPTHLSPSTQVIPAPRVIDVFKWNISFMGSSSKDSVNAFLEKVEL